MNLIRMAAYTQNRSVDIGANNRIPIINHLSICDPESKTSRVHPDTAISKGINTHSIPA
jgi:hypothetical protein